MAWEDMDTRLDRKPYLTIPTCSCSYIKWVLKTEGVNYPHLGHRVFPTRVKNDQCVYCGYYVCWRRIPFSLFESTAIPYWSSPEWYESNVESTWYVRYLESKGKFLNIGGIDP